MSHHRRSIWRNVFSVTASFAVLISMVVVAAAPIEATSPGASGNIVFVHKLGDAADDLVSMTAGGSERTVLFEAQHTLLQDPAWSPDGSKVAFSAWGPERMIGSARGGSRPIRGEGLSVLWTVCDFVRVPAALNLGDVESPSRAFEVPHPPPNQALLLGARCSNLFDTTKLIRRRGPGIEV